MTDTANNANDSVKPSRLMSAATGFVEWIDARLPVVRAWKQHMSEYYAPKNFNFWYYFGVLSLVVLVMQLLTGKIGRASCRERV